MSGMKWIGALAFASLAAIAGCDKGATTKEEDSAKVGEAEDSQVIARVNGEEITVHQLNAELAQLGKTEDPIETRRLALQAIVYRTALRQSAVKDALDRQPVTVVQAEAAKDKVLAETYLRAQTATTPPPTVSEIDDFMLRNPLMFDRRRIYDFKRLILAANSFSDDMVKLFDEKTDFTSLEADLKEKGIVYQIDDVRLPSGNFPADARERLRDMVRNDNLIVRSDDTIAIMKIMNWEDAPMPRNKGRELAQALLYQQTVQQRAETTKENILATAKIDFLGEFDGLTIKDAPFVTGTQDNSVQDPQPAEAPEAVATPEGQ